MNTYAGTITFSSEVDINKIQGKKLEVGGEGFTVFVFGQTKSEDSQALLDDFQKLGEVLSYDLSISTEDSINLMNTDLEEEGIYECASFQGPEVDYADVLARFNEVYEVMSVREAEESEKYGNRVVKVDFVY